MGLLLGGCVGDRVLRIDSIPSGAEVRLDDALVGVTPLEIPFAHYGQRRLALYKDGYRTYSEPLALRAPWHARFPIDIVTEIILPLGLDDVRDINVDLVADTGEEAAEATQEFNENALRARAGGDLRGITIAGQSPVLDGPAPVLEKQPGGGDLR